MPNDPLIEKYVEKFAKDYGRKYTIKAEPEDFIHEGLDSSQFLSHATSFLRTSLKEYGDKRVREERESIIRNIEGRTNYCGICKVWLKDGEDCECI